MSATLQHPPGIRFADAALLPPPQCAKCAEPLADTDVMFGDGRHCMHCFNAIASLEAGIAEAKGYEPFGSPTGIFTPDQWDAFISEECIRG